MVARLSVLQLFPAFAVAAARNDPPLSSERAWAPPNLPNYDANSAEVKLGRE